MARGTVARETRDSVVAALRHEALPCPARGLELVLYPLASVRTPTVEPAFDLNLNTGARIEFRVDYEPDPEDTHWFAIDRSIVAERGIALFGPPASEIFTPIPHELILPLLVASLRWHARGDAPADDAVLNACRTLRYAVEKTWSSKPVAGRWAVDRVEDPDLVDEALASRQDRRALDPDRVGAFLERVIAAIETPA